MLIDFGSGKMCGALKNVSTEHAGVEKGRKNKF